MEHQHPYSMIDGVVIPVTPGALLERHDGSDVAPAPLDLAALRALFDEVLRDAGHDHFQAWSDPDEGPAYRRRLERRWERYEADMRRRLDALLKGGM